MTTTYTQTFNRDDIRRVYASFAADYTIVAEWTGLRSSTHVSKVLGEIKWLAEEQYLKAVHVHLTSSTGRIKEAAVYRVSTDASGWSSDRPGDLYWDSSYGDELNLVVYYSQKWWDLPETEQRALKAKYLPGWGTSDFDGNYGLMSSSSDRRYASRAYGLERTRYSS